MATLDITHSYYFYPLTQTYSSQQSKRLSDEPSVSIELTTSEELPSGKLAEIINKLGNFTALYSLKVISRDTESNYCTDYTKHRSTCKQSNWNYCQRHLTTDEINECSKMEKQVDPLFMKGILYKANGLVLLRGEVDLMRRILHCVRNAIN